VRVPVDVAWTPSTTIEVNAVALATSATRFITVFEILCMVRCIPLSLLRAASGGESLIFLQR